MLNPSASAAPVGQDSPAPFTATPVRTSASKRIDSLRLLGGGRELVIEHAGQEYRLRLTRHP